MNFIDKDLLLVVEAYVQKLISIDQLRAFLADRFFPLPESLNPFEAMVIGELELCLAEMDRGDRPEHDVQEMARLFAFVFKTLGRSIQQPLPEVSLILTSAR